MIFNTIYDNKLFKKQALQLAFGLILRANFASAVFIGLIWIFKGFDLYLMLLNWFLWNSVALIMSVLFLWKNRFK